MELDHRGFLGNRSFVCRACFSEVTGIFMSYLNTYFYIRLKAATICSRIQEIRTDYLNRKLLKSLSDCNEMPVVVDYPAGYP